MPGCNITRRRTRSRWRSRCIAETGLVLVLCGVCVAARASGAAPLTIAQIEEQYQATRALRDAIDVTRSRGAAQSLEGVALTDLVGRYNAQRAVLAQALAAGAAPPLSPEDDRALAVMRETLARDLDALTPAAAAAGTAARIDCRYDAARLAAGEGGYAALTQRIYACFSQAARALRFDGETLDRLSVFGRLPLTDDAAARERLWRSMAPIWRAVNGDNGPGSPYRTLIRMNAARLAQAHQALGASVRGIGVEPAQMEQWLVQVLERWRDITPPEPIEPWDFAFRAGRANRVLSAALPVEALRRVNDRFYRDLGADPAALHVHYDLEPRANKDPVAFTTFGRRPQRTAGGWTPAEPWVFAAYQIGGLDNLLELLHESGHAIHIAAIRTRPAFMDWPDSDIFTEGIADIATLEMYEPAWQQRYLGKALSIDANIRAKYAGIVMDIAWALFEVRMHRTPERDPNQVWTEITREYFHIAPHPELAWWAVRGQLIDAPGYMMNYAAGAILNADLRARARALYGPYTEGEPDWYRRISASLYRFGLERTSVRVIEDFLGRAVSPQALLDDMARAARGGAH
jgi:hypothetical protein